MQNIQQVTEEAWKNAGSSSFKTYSTIENNTIMLNTLATNWRRMKHFSPNCKLPYTHTIQTQSGSISDNRRRCVAVFFYQDATT